MGLKMRLEWYDKETEICQGEELTADFGDDNSIIDTLGLSVENTINNGGLNVVSKWIPILQPHFRHAISPFVFDYQVAFVFRENW